MVEMDDEVADAERREFGEEGVGALAALLAADEAFAENILFGEQADRVAREPMVERQHDHRGRTAGFGRGGTERFLPAVDRRERGDAMLAQQAREAIARAARVAGDDRAARLAALVGEMVGDLLIDIGVGGAFGGEIAGGEGFEVDDLRRRGDVEGRDDVDRAADGGAGPVALGQIECVGRERAIAAGALLCGRDAVGVIIGDRGEARLGARLGAVAAQHRGCGVDMVKQGR